MDNENYEKIIREGEMAEWYGIEVPKQLITPTVRLASSNLSDEIDKLESSLGDLKGVDHDKRRKYINSLKKNIQNMPYTLNGDFYLVKKKRIEEETQKSNLTLKKTKK